MRRDVPRFVTGWRLVGSVTFVLGLTALALAGWNHFDVDGVRMIVRDTARTSLLLFCLAITAAPLAHLWPNAWTRWQRANRRYLGVSFAVSHLIHAIGIVSFALMDPALFQQGRTVAAYVFGGVGYAFIVAMTATSFDRSAAAIGPRAWKALHRAGVYYLWLVFLVGFAGRAGANPFYWIFVAVLIAAAAIRALGGYAAKYAPTLKVGKRA